MQNNNNNTISNNENMLWTQVNVNEANYEVVR